MNIAFLVQGMAFGDESKGATVDKLCRSFPVDLVVRFNGGSQAAHNVVTPRGMHHTFSQFGSGSFVGDHVRTHLSRFMLVDPLTMMTEADALHSKGVRPWRSTTVDAKCVIITPFHKVLNRAREELRGMDRHGSCGMGVGAAREMHLKYGDHVLFAGDLADEALTLRKLQFIGDVVAEELGATHTLDLDPQHLAARYANWPATVVRSMPNSKKAIVFEGAQGVLLDETHGFAPPHNTWTDCTFANAETLCDEAGILARVRIGCFRSYFTRHGAGPFPSETMYGFHPPELHNGGGPYQGDFRVGDFDFNLARKALGIAGGVDCLSISHLDISSGWSPHYISKALRVPLGMTADGPSAARRMLHSVLVSVGAQ